MRQRQCPTVISTSKTLSCSEGRELGGPATGNASEDDPSDEARAAAIVVIVEPANDFARRIEPPDRRPRGVLDLGRGRDAQAPEREGNASRHAVGMVRRCVESVRPVALV